MQKVKKIPMKGMSEELAHTMLHGSMLAHKVLGSMSLTIAQATEYDETQKITELSALTLAKATIGRFILAVEKTQLDQGRNPADFDCEGCKKLIEDREEQIIKGKEQQRKEQAAQNNEQEEQPKPRLNTGFFN